jgi:hypothetical protein
MSKPQPRSAVKRNQKKSPPSDSKKKEMTCDDCNMRFDIRAKFISHITEHLPKQYACKESKCEETFLEQIDLSHHTVMHHNFSMCYNCDQTFRNPSDAAYLPGQHTCERYQKFIFGGPISLFKKYFSGNPLIPKFLPFY